MKQVQSQDTNNYLDESSGFSAFQINKQGQIAILSNSGNLYIYDIKNPSKLIKSFNLGINKDGKQVNSVHRSGHTQCYYNLVLWWENYQQNNQQQEIIITFNVIGKNIIFLNLKTLKIYNLNVDFYISSLIQLSQNQLLISTQLHGKLYCLTDINKICDYLCDKFNGKIQISLKTLNFNQSENLNLLELKQPIDQATIYTTPFLHWSNIWFPTCLSSDLEKQSKIFLTVWTGGLIFFHNQDLNFTSVRQISSITCGCWLSNGFLAFGTESGIIQIVSFQHFLRTQQNLSEIKNYQNISLSFDKKLEQKIFTQKQKIFNQEETKFQFSTHENQSIIAIKYNQETQILSFVNSGGQYFIYDLIQHNMIYQSTQNHQSTILSLQQHPTIPNTFITVSGDSTAKIYTNMQFQASYGVTQISTIIKNKIQEQNDIYGGFLSVSWDKRNKSSLCAIGTINGYLLIVDCYRNKLHKQILLSKDTRIFDVQWNQNIIIAICENGQIYQIFIDNFQPKLLIHLDTQLRCSDISLHDQMLGCAGTDGYARIFAKQDDYYQQIGKFSVTSQSLHQLKFHPSLPQTLAVSSDDGSVKIYRYDSSHNNFKVQCVNTLKHNDYKARCIQFNPYIPNLIAVSKWSGYIEIYDWIQNKFLSQFECQQDIYGIEFNKNFPLELISAGRDLSIRKLFLSEISTKLIFQTILSPLNSSFNDLNIKNKTDFIRNQNQIKISFLQNLKQKIKKPSFSFMKNNQNFQILTEQFLGPIVKNIEQNPLNQIFSVLINLFTYSQSGNQELIQYFNFWLEKFNDVLNPHEQFVQDIKNDELFYEECEISNGIVLSGRSLIHGALQLGRHYFNALFGESKDSAVNQKFETQRYKFYEFQRQMSQNKIQAFKQQFHQCVMLLACSGDFNNVKLALKNVNSNFSAWFGSSEFYFERSDNQRYEDEFSSYEVKILKAVGYYSQTQDSHLIESVIEEICEQNIFQLGTYVKILSTLIQSENLLKKSSNLISCKFLQNSEFLKVLMEILTQNETEKLNFVLELNENDALNAILYLSSFQGINSQNFDKLALISCKYKVNLTNFQYFTQNKNYWILHSYIRDYGEIIKNFEENGVKESSQFNIHFIQTEINKILEFQPQKFEQFIIQCQKPDNFMYIVSQMQGNSIQMQYKQGVLFLLDIVNKYVLNALILKQNIKGLNKLYQMFMFRSIQPGNELNLGHILNSILSLKQNLEYLNNKNVQILIQQIEKSINYSKLQDSELNQIQNLVEEIKKQNNQLEGQRDEKQWQNQILSQISEDILFRYQIYI